MKAVTLRNIPPEVARAISRKAATERISLNKAAISLIEERLGTAGRKSGKKRHRDLDFLVGMWTKEEADEFDKALAWQRTIDPEMWK